MKAVLTLLVAASLAVNLVLITLLFAGRNAPDTATVAPSRSAPAAGSPAPAADPATWQELQSEELPQFVQRLRERGFPPEIVRALTAARLREKYAAQHRALDPEADTRAYWKSPYTDMRLQTAAQKLYRQEQQELRDLLGPDAERGEPGQALYRGRRLDSIPAGKVPDVERVLRQFDDARNDLFTGVGGLITADLSRKINALEKDMQDALGRVLTPEELEEYNLRSSDTSRSLRYQLSAFNPTEQEFRAIYKLQAEFDARFGRMFSLPTAEEQQRRSEAQRQLNEQIKAVLGPVRAPDYERANDYNYRQTSQLVARLEMPPETTNAIWDVQKDLQSRLTSIYRAASAERRPLNDAEQSQLNALAGEAKTRISSLLGERGFEAYKQYGGSWMQSLTRRPGQPGTTTGTTTTSIRIGP